VKYWEIITDNLSKARWSWGYVATMDRGGRTTFIADAHRDQKRFTARAACDIAKHKDVTDSDPQVPTSANRYLNRPRQVWRQAASA
jgi:hypothetical protein